MPDIDTGQRGTGVVNVIKLQLDVNHDGVMDLSFGGPDSTSYDRPFVFWINDDHDEPASGSKPDRDLAVPGNPPDYSYSQIRCQRNLEDFARLWISGVPGVLNQGYSVTLSMIASSGSPAINLYNTADSTGGITYLTDTNAAAEQIAPTTSRGLALGRISPLNTYTFWDDAFTNGQARHFLFEATDTGSGQIVLTFSIGSTNLAQTSLWFDFHKIQDLYERAVITNKTSGAISNWSGGLQIVAPAALSSLGDDADLIVLVHGINVSVPAWRTASDTVFKRLYWSGYHGKFVTVKWPCEFFDLWTALALDVSVFNRSEVKAYKAGAALHAYLDQLHTRFADHRIHLLAHSQGNAVVSEAIEGSAAFDIYILTEGALPASAYDVNAPLDSYLMSCETNSPTPEWRLMGYRGVYTNMTGRIVNFYNPFDPVLNYWKADQAAQKPGLNYQYIGTNGWHFGPGLTSYIVTDPQESRAFVSRSRTLPIGHSGPASSHGVIQSGVDLNAAYGFRDAFPDDHSGQWTRSIQNTRPYYLKILDSIQP